VRGDSQARFRENLTVKLPWVTRLFATAIKKMRLTNDIITGLGVAFNDTSLLGVEFEQNRKLLACTFEPIRVDKDGNVPQERRVQVILKSVGRTVVARCRNAGHVSGIIPKSPVLLSPE
jgi:hypothetical protein